MTILLPVMLVHGFNGSPSGWDRSGFRPALLAAGLEPALVRQFHYGWRTEGEQARYDNQGDLRRIASRLAWTESREPEHLESQLARLSAASVDRGGPPDVAIVAHSMGGLIARYYLSRSEPDEFGTVNEDLVSRLITIGTPHLGLDLARVTEIVPPDSFLWRLLGWLEGLPFLTANASRELRQVAAQVRALQVEARMALAGVGPMAKGYADSPALRQMVPGSDFLQAIAAPDRFPPAIDLTLIWGDVRVASRLRLGPMTFWERLVTLGDLLVPASSAAWPTRRPATRHALYWERAFDIELGVPAFIPLDLSDLLPVVAHANLLENPEVHRRTLTALGIGG